MTVKAGAIPALLALLAAGLPGAARGGVFPSASTGDIWFQVDHAGFLRENEVIEEYYFRVPNQQLEFREEGGGDAPALAGRVFISLTFLDAHEKELGKASGKFEFKVPDASAAASTDLVQLFVLREPLHPRAVQVEVEMEDLNARKRGLIYLVTKKRRNGTARASLVPPPFPGQEFGLSDIQFVWNAGAGDEASSPFYKQGFNVVPNPGRIYGLYRDTLQVFYEVYDRNPAGGGTYFASLGVRDASGSLRLAREDTVTAPGGQWVHAPRLPVAELPAGAYELHVDLREFGSGRTARAVRSFSVAWSEGFWGLTEQEILDEARVLLAEADYDRFKVMQAGDREAHLISFWASHDPSPNTARNELREVFEARVDYARRNFSGSMEPGLVSDRGRVFIRYGPPDEITREVLPQMGSTLSDVLEEAEEDNPELGRLTSGNANAVDTRPYEIWSYTRQGEPLFPDRERITSTTGLTFIFVDEQGIGNYVLRYSSAFKRF